MTALVIAVGVVALISAVGVVTFSQTLYSALSLVGNMVCLAVLFLLLNAQFLAAVQVIIYAGAVMVLFVFIIALLNPGADETPTRDWRWILGLIALVYVTLQIFVLVDNGTTYNKDTHQLRGQELALRANPADRSFIYRPDDVNKAGNVQTVGGQLFTTFLLPFEITSMLLLVAAVGAVYLTRRPPTDRTR